MANDLQTLFFTGEKLRRGFIYTVHHFNCIIIAIFDAIGFTIEADNAIIQLHQSINI